MQQLQTSSTNTHTPTHSRAEMICILYRISYLGCKHSNVYSAKCQSSRYDQCWGVTEYMYRRYGLRIQMISNCIPLRSVYYSFS